MAGLARRGQGLMLRLMTDGDREGTPIISAPGNVKFGLTDAEAEQAVSLLLAVPLCSRPTDHSCCAASTPSAPPTCSTLRC